MADWKSVEATAVARRTALCATSLQAILGEANPVDYPRIGLCLSGGGWRAMTSGCALFDALSAPLAAKETHSGGSVKLLDCVTHAFGLSGGSWLLYTTLAGGAYNPFHEVHESPWLHGSNGFDASLHKYTGLVRMLSRSTVNASCHRGNLRQRLGYVTTSTNTDSTIGAALACRRLGESLVDRWSNFIANDILGWLDDNSNLAASTEEAETADLPKEATRNARDDALCHQDNMTHPSRHVDFASLQELIAEGKLPFFVCAAIADRPGAVAENQSMTDVEAVKEKKKSDPKAGTFASAKRAYNWVEFTPFFARNPSTGVVVAQVSKLNALFSRGKPERIPLRVHHLMGICGSAFACDIACALPPGIARKVELPHTAVIGRGTSDVFGPSSRDESEGCIGTLRDAGIDFNVPLPPMLHEAGRNFDIIVVMDAGGGSTGPYELQRAVELGYVELVDGSDVTSPFSPKQRVKVFRGKGGSPTIIYFLGLTQRGTHQIVTNEDRVLRDVAALRESVEQQLQPVLLHEIRNVHRMKTLERSGSSTTLVAHAAMNALLTTSDEAAHNVADLVESTFEEDHADETRPAQERLDALLGNLPDVTRQLMFNAAARGSISSPFDAFVEVETVLVQSAAEAEPQRRQLIAELQNAAVSALIGQNVAQAFFDKLKPDVRELFTSFGCVEQNSTTGETSLSIPFVNYFAAAALAQHVAATSGVVPPPDAFMSLRSGPPDCAANLTSLPLATDSRFWQLAAMACDRLGFGPGLQSFATSNLREAVCATLAKIQTTSGEIAKELERVPSLAHLAKNAAVVVPRIEDDVTNTGAVANIAAAVTYACAFRQIRSEGTIKVVHDRFLAAFAVGAARCGNIRLLAACIQDSPSIFSNDSADAKRLLGYAPEAPNAGDVQRFIFTRLGATLTFHDACALGTVPALQEMVNLPANADRHNETLLAIEGAHEECVSLIFEHAASPEFRKWIAQECVQRHLLWAAIVPYVESIEIGDDPTQTEAIITFAEKCKRLTSVVHRGSPAGETSKLATRLAALKQRAEKRASDANAKQRLGAAKTVVSEKAREAGQKTVALAAGAATSMKKLFTGFGKKT